MRGLIRKTLLNTWSSERTLTRLLGMLLASTVMVLAAFLVVYYYNHFLFLGQKSPLDQGFNTLKQHILAEPGDSSSRLQLAALYFERGEYPKAIEQGGFVLDVNPESQDALYLVGLAHLQEGNPQKGIPLLTRFTNLRRASAMWRTDLHLEEALYYLGLAYIETGQLDHASQALKLALEINHTDADALFLLGQVYAELGQVEPAAEKYLAALDYVPDFEAAYQALIHLDPSSSPPAIQAYAEGGLAYCRRNYPAAQEKLIQALEAQPEFTPAYVLLGLVYEGQGDLDQAHQALEKAITLDPQNFLAQHVLGRLAASRGEAGGVEP